MIIRLFDTQIEFVEQSLTYENAQVINVEETFNLLKLCVNVLSKQYVKHYVSYGTLLGLVRQKSLITHDIDADISVFSEIDFVRIIPILETYGLKLVRYEKGVLYSLMHGRQYLDFYIIRELKSMNIYLGKLSFIRSCFLWECGYFVPKKIINEISELIIDDFIFYVPKRNKLYLYFMYGENWRIPIKNKPGVGQSSIPAAIFHLIKVLYWFLRMETTMILNSKIFR
jgi:hypothetical protein